MSHAFAVVVADVVVDDANDESSSAVDKIEHDSRRCATTSPADISSADSNRSS